MITEQAPRGPRPKRSTNWQESHPTIGLLIDEMVYEYQAELWSGVAQAAEQHDVNLLCFVGDPLRLPPNDSPANAIYDLAGPGSVDGLVIAGGTICARLGAQETQAFFARYQGLPVVSIGIALEGIPSILVDNEKGLRDALVHLIEHHGYRRIAFIRGPEANAEAQLRYQVYADVLDQHGIPQDPDLTAPGDFIRASGARAVEILLGRQRDSRIEAVVAANDNMALGALDALAERSIQVPGEVALVGFDDVEATQFVTPPLTTVRQPTHEIGTHAVECLLALLSGEEAPEQTVLPTELVIRRSCGCLSPTVLRASSDQGERTRQAEPVESAPPREQIISRVLEEPDWSVPREQALQLLDAFWQALSGDDEKAFLSRLDQFLTQTVAAGKRVSDWHDVISILRRNTLPHLEEKRLNQAEDLWHEGQLLISETVRRTQGHRILQTEQQAASLSDVGQQLITATEVDALVDTIAEQLPRLGIASGYLSLYESLRTPTKRARMFVAYDEQGAMKLERGDRSFPSRHLIARQALRGTRRRSMVVLPLYFHRSYLGFSLLETGSLEGAAFETLRAQISSALQSVLLLERVESRTLQLQTAAEVSRAASSILDPEELISKVVELVRKRFDLNYAGLFLVDQTGEWTGEPGRWAVLRAGTGEAGRKMLQEGHRLEVGGESMVGWCVANKQARIALDVGEEAVRFDNPLLADTRSEMAIPLISRGQAIGALTIQSTQEAAFSSEDVAILRTMAGQVANAIANARLFERTQAALREMQIVHRRRLHEEWTDYLKTSGTTSYELSRPGMSELGAAVLPEIQQALKHRQATVVAGDGRRGGRDQTALVAPIAVRGAIIGALGIHDEGRQWTEGEIALVETVAERMGLAAENLRLVDEAQRRAAHDRLTSEVTSRIRETLDMRSILKTAIQEVRQALDLPEVEVRLATPTTDQSGNGSERS